MQVTTIKYMCTKFGVDSSSCFPFRVQTHTQTVTDATIYVSAMPVWENDPQSAVKV